MKKSKIFKTLSAFALLTTSVVVPTILSSCSTNNGNGGNPGGSGDGSDSGGDSGSGGDNNAGGDNNNGGSEGDNNTGGDNDNVNRVTPKVNNEINFYGIVTELVDESGNIKPLSDLFIQRINEYNTTKNNIFSEKLDDNQLALIDIEISGENIDKECWIGNTEYESWSTNAITVRTKTDYSNRLIIESWRDLQDKLTVELITKYMFNNSSDIKFNSNDTFILVKDSKMFVNESDQSVVIHIKNQNNLTSNYELHIPLHNFVFKLGNIKLNLLSKNDNKIIIDNTNRNNNVSLLFQLGLNFKSQYENETLSLDRVFNKKHNYSANVDVYDWQKLKELFYSSSTETIVKNSLVSTTTINNLDVISDDVYEKMVKNNESKLKNDSKFINKQQWIDEFKLNSTYNLGWWWDEILLDDIWNNPIFDFGGVDEFPFVSGRNKVSLVKKNLGVKLFSMSDLTDNKPYVYFYYANVGVYNRKKIYSLKDNLYWIDGTNESKEINFGNFEYPYFEWDSIFNNDTILYFDWLDKAPKWFTTNLGGDSLTMSKEQIQSILKGKSNYEVFIWLIDNCDDFVVSTPSSDLFPNKEYKINKDNFDLNKIKELMDNNYLDVRYSDWYDDFINFEFECRFSNSYNLLPYTNKINTSNDVENIDKKYLPMNKTASKIMPFAIMNASSSGVPALYSSGGGGMGFDMFGPKAGYLSSSKLRLYFNYKK